MKVLFLDHDGVICLSPDWGGRFKKRKKYFTKHPVCSDSELPVNIRFDNFDRKSVEYLNDILEQTDADIVVSSDWRHFATLEELGNLYEQRGIIKRPIGVTKLVNDCEDYETFEFSRQWYSEQCRCIEIHQWLKDNPLVSKWVAVDDLALEKNGMYYSVEYTHDWGLENFVRTERTYEGIKQTGIKNKIISYLL